MKKIIFLSFLLLSCSAKKTELEVAFYTDISKNIWVERNYRSYCHPKQGQQIKITFPLISQNIIENIYNRGKDVLTFCEECHIDIVSIVPQDLQKLSPTELIQHLSSNKIVATNIYNKHEKTMTFKKHYNYQLNNKKILILSVIADGTNPSKPFYISDYRIENPQYEINKVTAKNNYDYMIMMLHTQTPILQNLKFQKEYFSNLLSTLTKKPNIIFTDTDKNFDLNGVKIIGYGHKKTKLSFEKKFGFFEKITSYDIKKEENEITIPKTMELVKKTDAFFSKKITTSLTDIPHRYNSISPLGNIVAYAMFKFLKSDMSLFNNSLLAKEIKKGDISVKDIYSILSSDKERMVYIKTRGEKLPQLISMALENDSSIYFNGKIISKNNSNNLKFQPNKIYRIITTESSIRNDTDMLNHITEFSILYIRLMDAIMWYARNHKIEDLKEKKDE